MIKRKNNDFIRGLKHICCLKLPPETFLNTQIFLTDDTCGAFLDICLSYGV